MQKTTIYDVAKKAGVCKATVSRVLNKTGPVSDKPRKTVLDAINDLHYNPSVIAQGMRSRLTKTIAVVMPDYGNPFLTLMYRHLEIALKQYNYMALICQTSGEFDEEVEYINRLVGRQVDGIILFTHNDNKEQAAFYNKIAKQLPITLFDESNDSLLLSQVSTNGYKGVREATQYLIDKGHTRIGCLVTKVGTARRRLQGYRDALAENGIKLPSGYVYPCESELTKTALAAEHYISLDPPPTAIIALADYLAIGVVKYLKDRKVQIPKDLEIIGFDDIEFASFINPELSTIAQPVTQLANEMVNLLMEKINDTDKISEVKKIMIDGQLILRSTTK